MALGIGFGYDDSKSSQTGRQGSEVQFPKQFILDLHNSLGGPLTINDLFKLSPKPRSMFGYPPRQQMEEPGGAFNLGFGPPNLGTTPGASTTPTVPLTPGSSSQTPTAPTPTAPSPTPQQQGGSMRTYSLADIEGAYFDDPDKWMDIPRLFKKAKINEESFTYDELSNAIRKAKKYGFSGRSRKNFARILAGLQRDDELQDEFAGGKGTGIF